MDSGTAPTVNRNQLGERQLACGRQVNLINDHDVFTAAKLLVDKHGDDAALVAATCADQMQDRGDQEGAVFWRQILAGIEELQRAPRGGVKR